MYFICKTFHSSLLNSKFSEEAYKSALRVGGFAFLNVSSLVRGKLMGWLLVAAKKVE